MLPSLPVTFLLMGHPLLGLMTCSTFPVLASLSAALPGRLRGTLPKLFPPWGRHSIIETKALATTLHSEHRLPARLSVLKSRWAVLSVLLPLLRLIGWLIPL